MARLRSSREAPRRGQWRRCEPREKRRARSKRSESERSTSSASTSSTRSTSTSSTSTSSTSTRSTRRESTSREAQEEKAQAREAREAQAEKHKKRSTRSTERRAQTGAKIWPRCRTLNRCAHQTCRCAFVRFRGGAAHTRADVVAVARTRARARTCTCTRTLHMHTRTRTRAHSTVARLTVEALGRQDYAAAAKAARGPGVRPWRRDSDGRCAATERADRSSRGGGDRLRRHVAAVMDGPHACTRLQQTVALPPAATALVASALGRFVEAEVQYHGFQFLKRSLFRGDVSSPWPLPPRARGAAHACVGCR